MGLQPLLQGVAASTAWGCSLYCGVGLQPLLRGVAASTTWGCSLYCVGLQLEFELAVEGRAEEVGAAHAPERTLSVSSGGGGGAAWRHVWRRLARRRGACGGGEAARLAHVEA